MFGTISHGMTPFSSGKRLKDLHVGKVLPQSFPFLLGCKLCTQTGQLMDCQTIQKDAFVGTTVKQTHLGGDGGSEDLMKRMQQIMVRAAGPNQTRFMVGTSSGLT